MRNTITLTEANMIGEFRRINNGAGVSMRVYGNKSGSVVRLGASQTAFTNPDDLRTLAANLLAAANRIEGVTV
jgi:hypothetical protein